MFCCTLLYVHSSIAIILMGKRELIALLNLSSWCLVMVERLFLAVPRGCLQFVIVVFPDHTHLLFLKDSISCMSLIEDGSLFQPCMVLGKNDILYTVTLVYGTKSLSDPRVLLSFDQTMDSTSEISTKLCLILKSIVKRCIFRRS